MLATLGYLFLLCAGLWLLAVVWKMMDEDFEVFCEPVSWRLVLVLLGYVAIFIAFRLSPFTMPVGGSA